MLYCYLVRVSIYLELRLISELFLVHVSVALCPFFSSECFFSPIEQNQGIALRRADVTYVKDI